MRKAINAIKYMAYSCIIYFIFAVPFCEYLVLFDSITVRPYCVVPFVLTAVWGLPAAIGCGIGNILSDIYCEADLLYSPIGFLIQIIVGYIMFSLWLRLRKYDSNVYRLNKVIKIVQFGGLSLMISVFVALIVYFCLSYSYEKNECFNLALLTFWNNFIFISTLGIPALIYLGQRFEIKSQARASNSFKRNILLTLNERFILNFIVASIGLSVIVGSLVYYYLYPFYKFNYVQLWTAVFQASSIFLIATMIPSLFLIRYVEKHVTVPIDQLSELENIFKSPNETDIKRGLEELQKRTNNFDSFESEIANLAHSFTSITHQIARFFEILSSKDDHADTILNEIDKARDNLNDQQNKLIEVPSIDLYATVNPALDIGGDFYDCFMIDDTHFGFVVAEVSDKSFSASLFKTSSRIIIEKHLKSTCCPSMALSLANFELCKSNKAKLLVSAIVGVLDLGTNTLSISNAGFDYPMIKQGNSCFELKRGKVDLALGVMDSVSFSEKSITLSSGDIVFIYTNGIPECMNKDNEEFGFDRMLTTLESYKDHGVMDMCNFMLHTVKDFSEGVTIHDDMTMLAFKIQ